MSRIDELKSKMKGKGFFVLTPEEKEEYRNLTKNPEDTSASGKTMEVSVEDFKGLLNRVKQLEEEKSKKDLEENLVLGTWNISSDKFPQKKARLRYYTDEKGVQKYIVDYKHLKYVFNSNKQKMEDWYTLQLLDKVNEDGSFSTTPFEIEITEWAKLPDEWLDITAEDNKTATRMIGRVPQTEVDYEHFRSTEGDEVEQVETKVVSICTVKIPEMGDIKLNRNILNS